MKSTRATLDILRNPVPCGDALARALCRPSQTSLERFRRIPSHQRLKIYAARPEYFLSHRCKIPPSSIIQSRLPRRARSPITLLAFQPLVALILSSETNLQFLHPCVPGKKDSSPFSSPFQSEYPVRGPVHDFSRASSNTTTLSFFHDSIPSSVSFWSSSARIIVE